MTDSNTNQPYSGRYNKDLFSPEFFALDYHEDQHRLTGITLGVHKNAATFTLTMATMDIYANRTVEDDEDAMDDVFVVPADEILPSDLIGIKNRILASDELDSFLVEQTY